MCEYSNVLIRGRRQSRDKQCNGQKKKDIRTNNHLQNIGIGRTGTYIALDALYENGQETGFVDVKEFTEMMRQNRMNMIQTVVQNVKTI
jgi:protein tyrosine phosphatase